MSSFALDLSKAVEKAKDRQTIAARKIMLELFTSVIEKSPVDTGRFRANWNVAYGSPDTTTSYSTDTDSIQKASAKVGVYELKDGSVWLSNSLPYSVRLENGWSKQSPAGMVRISLIEIQNRYGA